MGPQVVTDPRGVGAKLDVEGITERVGRIGAHDHGSIPGGGAAHSRRGGHGCLADPTLPCKEDDPHRSVATPKILASSVPGRPGANPPHEICDFAGTPGGAEGCVKGPGASSSRTSNALLVAPPFPCLRPPMTRICCGSRGRDTRESYGWVVSPGFRALSSAAISLTCSSTSDSTWRRIVSVISVFRSVSSVFFSIALRICTFWRSALSASWAACSRVKRSFCDCRLQASRSTGPVYAAWIEKARFSRMYG